MQFYTCYPFDGRCPCSRNANLSLTFDQDDKPLRVHSIFLSRTSTVLRKIIEECFVEDGTDETIHLGKDDKDGWILLLNMVHPISAPTLDRAQILSSMEIREKLGALAKKYDAEFMWDQLDEALYQQLCGKVCTIPLHHHHPPPPPPLSSNGPPRAPCQGNQPTQVYHLLHDPMPPPLYSVPAIPRAPPPRPPPPLYLFHPHAPEFNHAPTYPYYDGAGHFSPANVMPFPCPPSLDPPQRSNSSACYQLLPFIEHAGRLGLTKSWNYSVSQLVHVLRMECKMTAFLPMTTKALPSGANVKCMLQRLRDDGFDREALNLAMEFFDNF